MSVDYARLRNLSAREIVFGLIRDGFAFDRGDGSHQIFRHLDGRRVTVAFHGRGETFRRKTLKTIIETQARWTDEDLKRLKLI